MRSTMRRRAALGGVVTLLLATAPATLAAPCAVDTLQAVAIHTRAALRCHAVAAINAATVDPGCLARAGRRAAGRLQRALADGGCGAAAAPWDAMIAGFAADVNAASPATGDAAHRRCSGAIRSSTGRFAGAMLACAARATATGGPVDPACVGPAEDRFAAAVRAAVDRGDCAADLVRLAGLAEALVATARAALLDGATTTTTTVAATTTSTTQPPAIRFSADVVPIFAAHCVTIGCHVGQYAASGLDLSTAASAYAQLVGVASVEKPSLQRVRSRHPGSSYLLDKLQNAGAILGAPMPPTGALSATEIQTISDWIAAGAAND